MVWNNTKNWVDGCCMLNTENWVNVYTVRFQSDLWNRPSPFSLTISVIFICGFIWMGAWWWEKQRKAEKVLLLRGEPCTADAVSSAAASQICDSYSTVLGYHHPGPREGNGAGEQINEWTRSKGSHLLSLLGACPGLLSPKLSVPKSGPCLPPPSLSGTGRTRMLGTHPLKPSDSAVMAGHVGSMPPWAFVSILWTLGMGDLQIYVAAKTVSGVKEARSCPSLCDPMDCSPPGSSVHGDSPGKTTGVDCHALLQGIFQTPGIEPRSPQLQADSLPSELLVLAANVIW